MLFPCTSSYVADFSVLRVGSLEDAIYKEREQRIADMCNKNGVMIAPGQIYMAEEYGWFRVTFTVGREALQEGLNRLWVSIEEVNNLRLEWT